MTVQVATLDILTQRAHLDPEVARALGDAMAMEIAHPRESLATKQDVADLGHALRWEMTVLKSGIKEEMAALHTSLKQDMFHLKSETLRWMFAGGLSVTTLLLGGMYFMLESVR